jgi:hypothetical protein
MGKGFVTTRFTYWLGQRPLGAVLALLIEAYFTKNGRDLARKSRKLDGCCGGIHADF